jgi:peptide deformylase
MAYLPLVTLPNPELRKRSMDVDPAMIKTPEFQKWLDDLVETMWKADGVGIAAPQVGKPLRVFVAVDGKTPYIVIDPVAVKKSWRTEEGEEGCLSVPGKYGIVKRYRAFKVKGLDREGREVIHDAKGFFARVLQHELDHLDGVLFIDRAKKVFNLQE